MKEVRVHDVDLAADMFNLKTHLDNEELITYENV